MMQLTIEPTNQMTMLDGVPVRVWAGETADGVPCFVFVHRVAVKGTEDSTEFDEDLQEQLPPGRLVLLSAVL